jgi:hypothetical protein
MKKQIYKHIEKEQIDALFLVGKYIQMKIEENNIFRIDDLLKSVLDENDTEEFRNLLTIALTSDHNVVKKIIEYKKANNDTFKDYIYFYHNIVKDIVFTVSELLIFLYYNQKIILDIDHIRQ